MVNKLAGFSDAEFTLENLFASGFFGDAATTFSDDEMGLPPEFVMEGRTGRSDGRGVTENDWAQEEESEAFVRVVKALRTACNINTKDTPRAKSIEWVFTPGLEDDKGISFDLCCSALESRGDLLRTRLQHQLFESHIITAPLPFLSHGIPQILRSEIDYFCKPGCLKMAMELWANPGIRLDALASRLDIAGTEIEPMIESLNNAGYAGFWLGHGWFIGKNPLVMPRKERMCFRWTELVL